MEPTRDLATPTEHDTAAHVVSVVDLLLTIGYINGGDISIDSDVMY